MGTSSTLTALQSTAIAERVSSGVSALSNAAAAAAQACTTGEAAQKCCVHAVMVTGMPCVDQLRR